MPHDPPDDQPDEVPVALSVHVPVLPREVIAWLAPRDGGRYVDGTLGGAGHTAQLLEASAPGGRVLGIDADAQALGRAQARLADAVASGRLILRQGNFARMADLARSADSRRWMACCSTWVSRPTASPTARAFSFRHPDAPLDMRFDTSRASRRRTW
jgi:16S rRNA (cytosine1402-N4)-methyltransferase